MEKPMSTTLLLTTDDATRDTEPDTPGENGHEHSATERRAEHCDRTGGSANRLPELREERELEAILEALLFVAHEPLSLDRLCALVGDAKSDEVVQALGRLHDALEQGGRGLQLIEVAGGYRLATKAEYAPWVRRLEKIKTAPKLSRSALEVLAIIAYKQPIVRAEIEEIRGVETSGVLRTLLERKLVRIVGRKEVPGRPIMYGTTKFFLEHFGLRDLSELPPLKEFKELGEAEQTFLPMEEELAQGDRSTGHANVDPRSEPFGADGGSWATAVGCSSTLNLEPAE